MYLVIGFVTCQRLLYRQTVIPLNQAKYTKASKSLLEKVVGDDTLYASLNSAYCMCKVLCLEVVCLYSKQWLNYVPSRLLSEEDAHN